VAASLLAQYVLIALAVLASAGFVARRQFPGSVHKLRIICAVPLLRTGTPGWLRVFGRAIAPPTATANSACGSCNGCDKASQAH